MATVIHQGDVFSVLPTLEPRSIDCAVTSPPYWMLRSYLPKGHELKPLELGQEKTPAEYVANMVRVCRLVREVLADHGTLWVNIGDTYCDDSKHGGATTGKHVRALHGPDQAYRDKRTSGVVAGNMALIPQRLAIALCDDGWIVRSVVVWWKPAPMPISVVGWQWMRCRVRDSKFKEKRYAGKGPDDGPQSPAERMKTNTATMREHGGAHNNGAAGISSVGWIDCAGCKKCDPNDGYVLRKGSWRPTPSWEPILMLAKTADYFCDGEAVKRHDHETVCDNGANLRDVWRIAAEPLGEKHYAAYPTELVDPCLRAGTSAKWYCCSCGKPWVRVVESKSVPHPSPRGTGREGVDSKGGNQANGSAAVAPEVSTIGWRPSCRCPKSEPRAGRVLDPFSGSGRTGITAMRLGLDFVGVELNPEYVDMGRRLLREESPLFS